MEGDGRPGTPSDDTPTSRTGVASEDGVTARQIVPAQDAPAVNMVWSVLLHVTNAEVRRVQIL